MNKEEFLNILRKRLSVLEDSEIEDIISEYKGYIEEKVNVGLTEEEAVKELGNIDEIIQDLLAAYKVKEPKNDGINKAINKVSNAIDNFMSSLDDKSAKDIIRVLIEIIIILLAIWLLKIPFALIRDLGESIFYEVHNPIGNVFASIWWIVIEFSYIIVAVIFFFKMIEKRYFKNVSSKIIEEVEDDYKTEKSKKEAKTKSSKETEIKEKKVVTEAKKSPKVIVHERTFVDTLTDICITILKFFAVFFVVGVVFYLVGMSIALGLMVYLLCKGVTYFGILILLVAFFMGGALILEVLINFLFNKRNKASHIFGGLISCIIVLAVGITLSTIEIGNTEIIYDSTYSNSKKIEKVLPLNSKMDFYYYDNVLIDNTLNNEVRIEYLYPNIDGLDIDFDLTECGNGYCLHNEISSFRWNKKVLEYLIENLKDKRIYTHNFRFIKNIYVNELDLDKIVGHSYYPYHNEYNKAYTFTKTYNVLNIAPSNEEEYVYLTLRQFQFEEIETVKVLKIQASNIEVGKDYEFTFTYHGEEPDNDIREIFTECNLINIKATDKIGLDQIQDL